MSENVKLIGITGGIGSGKSVVGNYLREKGYTLVDADEVSREITAKGEPVLDRVREIFGDVVFMPDGSLDRGALGAIIFSDKEARDVVEKIFHEEIGNRIKVLCDEAIERGAMKVFLSIPLLYETGNDKRMDEIWVVTAKEEIRIKRVKKRDGLSEYEIRLRMQAQMPEEERLNKGAVIIENNGTQKELKGKIDNLLKYDLW